MLVSVLALTAVLLQAPAAPLTIDQAQTLAESFAGHALSPVPIPGAEKSLYARYADPEGAAPPRRSYTVHRGWGVVSGWTRDDTWPVCGPGEAGLTEADARALAEETVRACLPDLAAAIAWETALWNDGNGRAVLVGSWNEAEDMDRPCACVVRLHAPTGTVVGYHLGPPTRPLAPVAPPAVDREAALSSARDVLGLPEAVPEAGEVRMLGDRPVWRLRFREPEGMWSVEVDGRDGVARVIGGTGPAPSMRDAVLEASPTRLTMDEARAVAEEAMGISLEGATEEMGGIIDMAGDVAVFTLINRGATICKVNLESGGFVGYLRPMPYREYDDAGTVVTPLKISREEARELALAEAKRLMRDAFSRIETWTEDLSGGGAVYSILGESPRVGDPPRSGLSPRGRASVCLVTGTVIDYSQFIPVDAEPIPPEFAEEDAVAKALADWDIPEARLATERLLDGHIGLRQDPYGRGELTWVIPLMAEIITHEEGPDGEDIKRLDIVGRLYKIDALTGDIRGYSGTL